MANETTTTDPEDAALLDAVDRSMKSPADEPVVEPVITEDPAPSAVPLRETPAPSAPPRRSGTGGFLALVFGGALCAGAGFLLGESGLLRSTRLDGLEARIGAQASEIAALKSGNTRATAADPALLARLTALEDAEAEPAPAPDAGLTDRLATLESRVAGLQSAPAGGADPALAAELSALKSQVEGLKSGDAAAVETALAGVQQRIDAAAAAADNVAETAGAAARKTLALAAVGRLSAALDSGLPYGSALADLGEPVPAVLTEAAQSGLPTLNTLRDRFPAAARAGLEAALHANMGESWSDRVGNFLRAQTGARSLTPREGDDPDAVLSRAEAALAAGDAAAALTLVKSLPPEAQAAMADWTALADRRLAAEAAVAEIAVRVGGQ